MIRFSALWERMWKMVYPPRCVVCDRVMVGDAVVCGLRCLRRLVRQRLGTVIVLQNRSRRHFAQRMLPTFVMYRYDGVMGDALRRMKFQGKGYLARDMATLLAWECGLIGLPATETIVVHVPAYRKDDDRMIAMVAEEFAQKAGIVHVTGLLRKVKDTPKQHKSSFARRLTNQRGAFEARIPKELRGCLFVVVDDVVTSGSTLWECADALLKAGAGGVMGCVLCRARS